MNIPESFPTDIKVRQGNSYLLPFQALGSGVAIDLDAEYDDVVWSCETAVEGEQIVKKYSDGDMTWDAINKKMMVPLTLANTRALSPGRVNRWEFETWLDGDQETVSAGYMVVTEGVNVDA